MRLLTLLSDFGSRSPYPAAMKAVVAARADVRLIDITHDVRRHDVREGAFVLASVAPLCPPGTVHLAVVDPGVGTPRRPLLVASGGQVFIGPDNGLLLPAARRVGRPAAYLLDPAVGRPEISATFHGRDLFAPAAVRVLLGEPAGRLGRPIDDPVDLVWRAGTWEGDVLTGEVVYVDPFGNLVTSISASLVGADQVFALDTPRGGKTVVVRPTYGAGEPDALLLVPGSEGFVEIAVRGADAAARTGLGAGAVLRLRRRGVRRGRSRGRSE